MVLYDERSKTASANALLRLGQPVVVERLGAGEGSENYSLRLPDEAEFPGANDCPAYFIFSENVSMIYDFP